MALLTTDLTRVFKFKKDNKNVELADPNPAFSPEEVINFYATQHPELTTASIDKRDVQKQKIVYEIKTTIGKKG